LFCLTGERRRERRSRRYLRRKVALCDAGKQVFHLHYSLYTCRGYILAMVAGNSIHGQRALGRSTEELVHEGVLRGEHLRRIAHVHDPPPPEDRDVLADLPGRGD